MNPETPTPSRIAVTFGAATDVGMRRRENQDAWAHLPSAAVPYGIGDEELFIVADGMGGHSRGQEASGLAIRIIGDVFRADSSGGPLGERLRRAVAEANRAVFDRSRAGGAPEVMGTTCTVLALDERKAVIAHVGDSRAYLVRDGSIRQITHDHTQVAELEREGIITAEQALNHPRRSVLTRGLGVGPEVEVDVSSTLALRDDDLFVLCSDGLLSVPAQIILETVTTLDPPVAAARLIALANENGGPANITAVVVRVDSAVEPSEPAPTNADYDTLPLTDEPIPALPDVRPPQHSGRPPLRWPFIGAFVLLVLVVVYLLL